jgi:deoxyribodipyrimidine photo-lyase
MTINDDNNNEATGLIWFRNDLRLDDNEAVQKAVTSGLKLLAIYIDDANLSTRPLGSASKWWLDKSLRSLEKSLLAKGVNLIIRQGSALSTLQSLIKENHIKSIFCSATLDPVTEDWDRRIGALCHSIDVRFQSFLTGHLTAVSDIKTKDGQAFRVFSPFFRALTSSGYIDKAPIGRAASVFKRASPLSHSLTVDELGLRPKPTASGMNWAAGFEAWTPGESGAKAALHAFVEGGMLSYAIDRDRPDLDLTSRLSPHLRFGEISPLRLVTEVRKAAEQNPVLKKDADKFIAELAWREFSYGLLAIEPHLNHINFKRNFDNFPWQEDLTGLKAWQQGKTGFGLVDAGMRQLQQTGFMHNRVRMLVASFLCKHLLIDWRLGEAFFWDCLVDADPANNPASWQWVAGSGADAAPYFRIFNPISQAEKFDPDGIYRRRYGTYDDQFTFKATEQHGPNLFSSLKAEIRAPIIDHDFARQRALTAYQQRKV